MSCPTLVTYLHLLKKNQFLVISGSPHIVFLEGKNFVVPLLSIFFIIILIYRIAVVISIYFIQHQLFEVYTVTLVIHIYRLFKA